MAILRITTALNTLPYNTVRYSLPNLGSVEFYFYTNFVFDPIEQHLKTTYGPQLPVPILDNGPSFGFNVTYLGDNERVLTLGGQLSTPVTVPFRLLSSIRLVPDSNLFEPLRYLGFGQLMLKGGYPTKDTWDRTALLEYHYE